MKKHRSHLAYTAFCLLALILCMGCKLLYEPVPSSNAGNTNSPGLVQPSAGAKGVISEVGALAGPYGVLIAGALNLFLVAGAQVLNKRTMAKHTAEYHPPATATQKMSMGGG